MKPMYRVRRTALAELAMTGFDFTAWHGLALAGGTPKPIVQKPEQFGSLSFTETVSLGPVVRESGAVSE